jgi:hypothetical protein
LTALTFQLITVNQEKLNSAYDQRFEKITTLGVTKMISEKHQGISGQNDRIGGQDH